MNITTKLKGLVLTLLLSIIILSFFFGRIISDPNNYYFTVSGDGFQAYYGAIYHMQHDTSLHRVNGMNYPFGEMVFFTGCQPFLVNPLKFVSNNFVDLSDHIVGILNMSMILSILIAALIMFLILYELGLSWWYSSLVAIGICMLSPQIARMGGHFSLVYLFWIPWMIYLIIRFDKNPSVKISLQIALVTFLASGTHLYFVGFFGFMIGFYWANYLWKNRTRLKAYSYSFFMFLVQLVLPVVIIQLMMTFNDVVVDRTAFPYGFFAYKAHPVGIFLPSGFPYSFITKHVTVFRHIQWESLAFIGVGALGAFLYGSVIFVRRLITRKAFWKVTDSPILNQLFWASFAALLFSFGIPFIFGLNGLVDFLGPIRQLRALARFSWLFFYMINIVFFYVVYKKWLEGNTSFKWKIISVATILLFDGYWNISSTSAILANRNAMLEDKINQTVTNEWSKDINVDDYQAIFPLPYFHVGSENIWIDSKDGTAELTMNLSLKTGLPTNGVILSRTSIEQTYLNYQLVTEPLNYSKVLDQLKSKKPFLLLVNKTAYLNEDEQRISRIADLLYENDHFQLKRLFVEDLKSLSGGYKQELVSKINHSKFIKKGEYFVSDSTLYFDYYSFEEFEMNQGYDGDCSLNILHQQWNLLFQKELNGIANGKNIYVSFWVRNYSEDGRMRANIELIQKNPLDDSIVNYFYSDIHRHIKGFDGEWALVEFSFETKVESERVKLSIRNNVLKNGSTLIDGLLIRQEGLQLFSTDKEQSFLNGRKISMDISNNILNKISQN